MLCSEFRIKFGHKLHQHLKGPVGKAIEASENLSDEELIYTANFSVSKRDFNLLREEMAQVIQRFLIAVEKTNAEDIAQFNLDFFWNKN